MFNVHHQPSGRSLNNDGEREDTHARTRRLFYQLKVEPPIERLSRVVTTTQSDILSYNNTPSYLGGWLSG